VGVGLDELPDCEAIRRLAGREGSVFAQDGFSL
jgi:hypothetical protein